MTTPIFKVGIDDHEITDFEWATTALYAFHAAFRTLRIWIQSRWRLVVQSVTKCDSCEFGSTPAPYLQLMLMSQMNLEVQVTAILPRAADTPAGSQKFLIGANETAHLCELLNVCNPFFPRG